MHTSLSKIALPLILAISFSCKENSIEPDNTFEVTVAGDGIDCKLILIDFQQKDFDRIYQITGGDLARFNAYNLDKKFDQVGVVLVVTVRKTENGEYFACRTQGPAYPWVTILTATVKP